MKRLQGYKFQLRPNGEQTRKMRQFAGASRFVYNKALALEKTNYAETKKRIGYNTLAGQLVLWKKASATAFLKDVPAQALQQSLKDLDKAYTNFFRKRASFPTYKRKGQHDSFRLPQGCSLDQTNSRLFFPKMGWIRYRNSRLVEGELKNVTLSCSTGKWFVSIQTEREVETVVHPSASIIGMDVGIARFATLSDGTHVEPLHSFKKHQNRLTRVQRSMARKKKFSQNWKKEKARLQRCHTDIANARRDYLHKLSTTISQNHAIVCLEDLQIRNMSGSAAGTPEEPGRNVRAKSGLNRSILDQGWFEFRRQLQYKLDWKGGRLIAVPPRNTSRTCPICNTVSANNRKTQAAFLCVHCGYSNHADHVGAINILAAGHAVLACGESALLSRSMKQEPAEVTHAVLS